MPVLKLISEKLPIRQNWAKVRFLTSFRIIHSLRVPPPRCIHFLSVNLFLSSWDSASSLMVHNMLKIFRVSRYWGSRRNLPCASECFKFKLISSTWTWKSYAFQTHFQVRFNRSRGPFSGPETGKLAEEQRFRWTSEPNKALSENTRVYSIKHISHL